MLRNLFPLRQKSQRILDSSGSLNSQPATFHVQKRETAKSPRGDNQI